MGTKLFLEKEILKLPLLCVIELYKYVIYIPKVEITKGELLKLLLKLEKMWLLNLITFNAHVAIVNN